MSLDWGSGASGAASGAAIGTRILPGWGTAIGAGAGGLLGLFGGGGDDAPNFDTQSRPNVNTPWANQSWTTGPDGRPTLDFSLGGEAQGALTGLQGQMHSAADMDPAAARDAAIAQNYGFATSRLDPMWEQKGNQFTSGMANQGLDAGTEAYNNAFGNLSRDRNDSYSSALAAAIREGNATQMTQIAQGNAAYDRYGKLISASTTMPGSDPKSYGGAKDDYNIKTDNRNQMLGGLFDLGGSLANAYFGGGRLPNAGTGGAQNALNAFR